MSRARTCRFALALGLALAGAARAATPGGSSAKYGIVTDTLDAGGLLTASAKYGNIGSVGGIEGSSTSAKYSAGHGYIAQIVVATTTTTTAAPLTITYNPSAQTATLSATVTSQNLPVNTGTVTFYIKTLAPGTITLVGNSATGNVVAGVASVSYPIPAGQSAGSYEIEADYNPTSGLADSSSTDQRLTIQQAGASITTSDLSVQFSSATQTPQIDVIVTSPAGVVNEGVASCQIMDGNVNVGTVAAPKNVVNGAASLVYALPANTPAKQYTLKVSYTATNYAAADNSAAPNTFTVTAGNTTVLVTNTTYLLNSVANLPRLTAQILSGGSAVNEGIVTFSVFNSSNQLVGSAVDSGTVTNGIAQVDYLLPLNTQQGMYTIMAAFKNSSNFNAQTNAGPLNLIANTDPNAAVFLGAIQSSRNPARTNVAVTFSIDVNVTGDPGNASFQWRVYSVNNGVLTLLPPIDTTASTTRTFTSPGTYIVKVDVSNGAATSKTFDYVAVSLDPNADGVGQNIADTTNDPNSTDTTQIKVGSSLGGVLDFDVTQTNRDAGDDYTGLVGRSDFFFQNNYTAIRFTQASIYVVQAKDATAGTVGAVVAQRMVAISQKEISPDSSVIVTPSDLSFTKPTISAKFNFKSTTKRRDTLNLSFNFKLPGGIDFRQDQFVAIGIGNAIVTLKMDSKGKKGTKQPPAGTDPSPVPTPSIALKSFTLSYSIRRGTIAPVDTAATVKMNLSTPDLVTNGFAFLGINPTPGQTTVPATPVMVETLMVFRGVPYRQVITAVYSCKKGVGQLTMPKTH